jgi:hypothetical protein
MLAFLAGQGHKTSRDITPEHKKNTQVRFNIGYYAEFILDCANSGIPTFLKYLARFINIVVPVWPQI